MEVLESKTFPKQKTPIESIIGKARAYIFEYLKVGLWISSAGWGIYPIGMLIAGNERLMEYMHIDPISTSITFIGMVGIPLTLWSKLVDQSMGNIFGNEPILSRIARRINHSNIARFKQREWDTISPLRYPKITWCVQSYFSWTTIPENITNAIDSVEEALLFFPPFMVQQHLDTIIFTRTDEWRFHGESKNMEQQWKHLPKDVTTHIQEALDERGGNINDGQSGYLGKSMRKDKSMMIWIIIEWDTQIFNHIPDVIYHEFTHMILMHGVNSHFTRSWKQEFWEYQEDQTEYLPIPYISDKIHYGVIAAEEDMATIGEHMFTKVWWDSIHSWIKKNNTEGVRPWILQRKVERMIDFFSQQSGWKLDRSFFDQIVSGKITNSKQAQAYFNNLQ